MQNIFRKKVNIFLFFLEKINTRVAEMDKNRIFDMKNTSKNRVVLCQVELQYSDNFNRCESKAG